MTYNTIPLVLTLLTEREGGCIDFLIREEQTPICFPPIFYIKPYTKPYIQHRLYIVEKINYRKTPKIK